MKAIVIVISARRGARPQPPPPDRARESSVPAGEVTGVGGAVFALPVTAQFLVEAAPPVAPRDAAAPPRAPTATRPGRHTRGRATSWRPRRRGRPTCAPCLSTPPASARAAASSRAVGLQPQEGRVGPCGVERAARAQRNGLQQRPV